MTHHDRFEETPDPYQLIQCSILRERIRQTRQTFNLAQLGIVMSLAVITAGCVLLLMGKSTEGTVNTVTGGLSIPFFFQVAKDSSDKLDELTEDVKKLRAE